MKSLPLFIKLSFLWLAYTFFLSFTGCKKNRIPSKSSQKAIISFVLKASDNSPFLISDVAGNIVADTIILSLNQGTGINNLTPAILYTGAKISPLSNVAQNFNTPVNYIVTAEDGSTRKYAVKIIFLKANLRVYVGCEDGKLYAFNASTGAVKWNYTTGGAIQSSPTIANNIVYVGSYDKYLYAIDAITGILKWKYLTAYPIATQSPVVSNGVVFITCGVAYPSGAIYAIDAITGSLKWSLSNNQTSFPVPYSPTIADGKVFVGFFAGGVSAYDELSGNFLWANPALDITKTNPAISNGKLYTGSSTGIYCLDPNTGNQIWRASGFANLSSPTIDNGKVYVGFGNSFFEALDAISGIQIWQSTVHLNNPTVQTFSSAVVLNGIVYTGNYNGTLYALNSSNGSFIWNYVTNTTGFPNPTAANGIVYFGTGDKNFYAAEAGTGNIIWSFNAAAAVFSGPCIVDSDGAIFHAGNSGSKN